MTGTVTVSTVEHELAARVIDTLLREDFGGLSRRVHPHQDGLALHLPAQPGRPTPVLPLEPDGFLADYRIRRDGHPGLTLDHVRAVLTEIAHPADRDGAAAFVAECQQALAALRLRQQHGLPGHQLRGHSLPGYRQATADQGPWLGLAGQCRYDALAALMPHPAYPTGASRAGFSDDDSLRYAPEFRPEFELSWVAIDRSALTRGDSGQLVPGQLVPGQPGPGQPADSQPPWWPAPADVGLPPQLSRTHDLIPVHPLTARHRLAAALQEAGLQEAALQEAGLAGTGRTGLAASVIAPATSLRVTPTLSTRTVAVLGSPGEHLKLPLPTSTLGQRNRRSIQPGTLADGALVGRTLAGIVAADPHLRAALLLADDRHYVHAGHRYLGALLRRFPDGLDESAVVPLAALLAPTPQAAAGVTRPLVIEELARWWPGGDVMTLFAAYLEVLFGIHVRLFTVYGIALEAHQQNAALVLRSPTAAAAPTAPAAPAVPSSVRLLVKDFDGALIHYPRLAGALGPAAPARSAFGDDRLLTRSDDALADVFITIVLHLCAGALAFGLADHGAAPLRELLGLVRGTLSDAIDRHPGAPADRLRARALGADRLTGKSMVTAGTLVTKMRTGARDINKFYGTTGPNYLAPGAGGRT